MSDTAYAVLEGPFAWWVIYAAILVIAARWLPPEESPGPGA